MVFQFFLYNVTVLRVHEGKKRKKVYSEILRVQLSISPVSGGVWWWPGEKKEDETRRAGARGGKLGGRSGQG